MKNSSKLTIEKCDHCKGLGTEVYEVEDDDHPRPNTYDYVRKCGKCKGSGLLQVLTVITVSAFSPSPPLHGISLNKFRKQGGLVA